MFTLSWRASRIAARDAVTIPFPIEDTTPPVTKMYLVIPIESGNAVPWLGKSRTQILISVVLERALTSSKFPVTTLIKNVACRGVGHSQSEIPTKWTGFELSMCPSNI